VSLELEKARDRLSMAMSPWAERYVGDGVWGSRITGPDEELALAIAGMLLAMTEPVPAESPLVPDLVARYGLCVRPGCGHSAGGHSGSGECAHCPCWRLQ
jgi:hypothetical protein